MSDQYLFSFSEDDKPIERPLQCGECKKKASVLYTEVVKNSIIHTRMCEDCPELQRRLHGISPKKEGEVSLGEAGLCCGNCGTTLDAVRTGNPLGCSECYDVFEDEIIKELISAKSFPSRLSNVKKSVPLHIGRVSMQSQEMSPALKLLGLNEALNETLKREDYEQAALLRDQIKAMTEKQNERKE